MEYNDNEFVKFAKDKEITKKEPIIKLNNDINIIIEFDFQDPKKIRMSPTKPLVPGKPIDEIIKKLKEEII